MAINSFDNSQLKSYEDFQRLVYAARTSDLSPMVKVFLKFAKNEDIDSGVEEDIWSVGGTRTRTTSASVLEVLSASDNDTSDGTGARTVHISGYDANYDLIEETVTLNGTTAVETSQQFIDIWRTQVTSVGTGLTNAGTITVRQKTGPVVIGDLPAGEGITHLSHFTIPNGYTGFLVEVIQSLGGTQAAGGERIGLISMKRRDITSGIETHAFDLHHTSNSGPVDFYPQAVLSLPEKSQFWFTCSTETNNAKASVIYTVVCIQNEYL